MNDNNLKFDPKKIWPWTAIFAVLIALPLQLHSQGRIWWCACGNCNPWAGDVWSMHNSQHLFDPYLFTHILHGVLFCGILAWLLPKVPMIWRLWMAISLEALWEVLENSQFIIQRYRESTMALGYNGDSIINSMGDLLSCTAGFVLARYLGLRYSIVLIIVIEIVLLFWIRDNLILNIIMLVCPIDAIKNWQMIH
ncbi:MAG TPA: hypothetical protein DET40_10440 [Lentisphaeria bacterium]|nr:MAG: hypothetical protein A2X45_09835 [Lentisphaerae bacterium GWF2_50_93]HCE43955.1 hypothetical protein [Lentisphaeria bacterium]